MGSENRDLTPAPELTPDPEGGRLGVMQGPGAGRPAIVPLRTRPVVVAGGVLALALLVGLVDAASAYLRADMQGRPYSWTMALLDAVPNWLLLALLAPGVIAMARLVRLDRPRKALPIAAHVVAAAAFAIVHQVGVASFAALRLAGGHFTPLVWKLLTLYFVIDFVFYWAIVGVCYALDYARQLRQRELAASQLETRLSQARLQVLRSQLNPHFLFNTLNAIAVLALKGEREHVAHTLSLLSDLLRLSLDTSLPQEVPLARELQLMDRYLEIQQVRFPDRLRIERAIDPESLEALVPSLILQPLVENAVMHGVATRRGPGVIEVTATRRDGRLGVRVRDTGPGFAANPPVEGIGLRNTRARLEQLYGPEQRFECGNDDQGAWVRLEVPYRTAHKALAEAPAWTA